MLFIWLIFTSILPCHGDSMKLILLKDNDEAICCDGSPAGYWFREGISLDSWVIFLQGGGYCFDQYSCQQRWIDTPELMSSMNWSQIQSPSGILSSNPNINPHWHKSSAV